MESSTAPPFTNAKNSATCRAVSRDWVSCEIAAHINRDFLDVVLPSMSNCYTWVPDKMSFDSFQREEIELSRFAHPLVQELGCLAAKSSRSCAVSQLWARDSTQVEFPILPLGDHALNTRCIRRRHSESPVSNPSVPMFFAVNFELSRSSMCLRHHSPLSTQSRHRGLPSSHPCENCETELHYHRLVEILQSLRIKFIK